MGTGFRPARGVRSRSGHRGRAQVAVRLHRTHSRLVSSIEFPAPMENEVVQCGRQGPQAVELLAGLDEHVFREAEAAQTPARAPHALDGRFVALRHDDEAVQVAAFIRRAPRVRAKQPEALGVEFFRQPVGDVIQEVLVSCFHRKERSMIRALMGRVPWRAWRRKVVSVILRPAGRAVLLFRRLHLEDQFVKVKGSPISVSGQVGKGICGSQPCFS